jgi:hypothetical protein
MQGSGQKTENLHSPLHPILGKPVLTLQRGPMSAIGSPKPSISRKSMAGQVLFALALLIIARLLWTRTQPEHLTIIGIDKIKISADHIYMFGHVSPIVQERSDNSISVQSIHDPARRTLVRNDPRYKFCQQDTADIVDGNLYYAIEPFSNSVFQRPQLGPPFYLSSFLLQSKTAGQKRTEFTQPPLPTREVRFRQMSLRGGEPREVAILQVEEFRLIGSRVFWIRPAVEESEAVIWEDPFGEQKSWLETSADMARLLGVALPEPLGIQKPWLETTAHSDLMLTSLTDGTTRCIRHGISRYTVLSAGNGESGVTWEELAPYPEATKVYYARASDGIVRSLNFAKGPMLTLLPEFGNRLYWTITEYGAGVEQYPHEVLMSSNRDGTDVRQVLTQIEKHPIWKLEFYPYRGVLYCLLEKPLLTANNHVPPILCRLHPDQPDPLEIVRRLPAHTSAFQFAEGHLYFVLQERHRGPWATLTNDDVSDSWTSTLCRLPLDR